MFIPIQRDTTVHLCSLFSSYIPPKYVEDFAWHNSSVARHDKSFDPNLFSTCSLAVCFDGFEETVSAVRV